MPTLRSEEESLNRLNLAVVIDERSGKLLCVSADFANGGFDFVRLLRCDFFLGGFFSSVIASSLFRSGSGTTISLAGIPWALSAGPFTG